MIKNYDYINGLHFAPNFQNNDQNSILKEFLGDVIIYVKMNVFDKK